MQYTADRLDLFEFHDAILTDASLADDVLNATVLFLNIHKNTPQNPDAFDMQIKEAKLTFTGFQVREATTEVPVKDPQNHTRRYKNEVTHSDDSAKAFFQNELQHAVTIYSLGAIDNGQYLMEACANSPFFTLKFSFTDLCVEWDEYMNKAWYERHFKKEQTLLLAASYGDRTVTVTHSFRQENTDRDSAVTVYMELAGTEYSATANNTEHALIMLAKKLPPEYRIKSCLTCRHGNFSPFGNEDNEALCLRDHDIKSKNDVVDLLSDWTELAKRRHTLFEVCENYNPLSHDCYTYNSFLYELEKE